MSDLEITEWATDLLRRSLTAARRFDPDVVIRVVPKGAGIDVQLAEAPAPDDLPSGIDDAITIAAGVTGLLDAQEPHSEFVLRPAGSIPNERAHD